MFGARPDLCADNACIEMWHAMSKKTLVDFLITTCHRQSLQRIAKMLVHQLTSSRMSPPKDIPLAFVYDGKLKYNIL